MNQLAEGIGYANFLFKVEHQVCTYLGLKVTRSFKALLKHNFCTLLERTKQDFIRWSSLPISLAGRIHSVKMTVLSMFLYLLQMIPIVLPKSILKQLDSYILKSFGISKIHK
jgi:hypothetical protein